jgi:hypothetical protein
MVDARFRQALSSSSLTIFTILTEKPSCLDSWFTRREFPDDRAAVFWPKPFFQYLRF